jgi:Leucine Rich repeats (2 copies)
MLGATSWLLAALVCVAGLTVGGCGGQATFEQARDSLPSDERDAVERVLGRSGLDASALLVQRDLYGVFWRGAASHAKKHGHEDRVDAVDRAPRDVRNVVAIDGGHVVALRVARTRLDDLSLIAPLKHLVVLDLHDDAIGRITGLDQLGDLDHLDLSGNRIAAIEGLGTLHSLRSLYLADNRIDRLDGLDGLAALEVLNVSGNALPRFEGIAGLPALRALSASRTAIEHIQGLEQEHELVELDLSFCRIERLENLCTVPKLKYLELWHNQVHSLGGLEEAHNLIYLGLGENGYPFGNPDNQAVEQRFCPGRLCAFM